MAVREAESKAAAPRTRRIKHPSLDERLDMGRAARDRTPPSSHAGWRPGRDRPDSVRLLEEQDRTRETDLVPRRAEKNIAKAHTRDSVEALSKLAELADGQYRIVSQPPVIIPARDLAATFGLSADEVMPTLHEQFRAYRATLPEDRRQLLERFRIVDAARKVVGVGSVGTRAFIVLLEGRDARDPLFLQIKEATASVLEGYLPRSRYRQHGERVVQGQRMMQAASDIFLGWTKGLDVQRHFYWRQLRDMKGSVLSRHR